MSDDPHQIESERVSDPRRDVSRQNTHVGINGMQKQRHDMRIARQR